MSRNRKSGTVTIIPNLRIIDIAEEGKGVGKADELVVFKSSGMNEYRLFRANAHNVSQTHDGSSMSAQVVERIRGVLQLWHTGAGSSLAVPMLASQVSTSSCVACSPVS